MKNILNDLYMKRFELLMEKGRQEGKIIDFDDYFYDRLKNVFVTSIPAYINVKYFNYALDINEEFDRSFQIFMEFKESNLFYGDSKYFELQDCDLHHSWVEINNYVYDPYFKMKFEKELYYKIFKPKNIKKYDHKSFREENKKLYDDIIFTSVLDFQPNGSKRHNLVLEIPNAIYYAKMSENKELLKELKDYLELISYNERQIIREINQKTLH